MSMIALKAEAKRLFDELNKFYRAMEDTKSDLEDEQDYNESERAEWDEESGEPEPDEVDNSQEIDLLRAQLLDLESVLSGFEEIKDALS